MHCFPAFPKLLPRRCQGTRVPSVRPPLTHVLPISHEDSGAHTHRLTLTPSLILPAHRDRAPRGRGVIPRPCKLRVFGVPPERLLPSSCPPIPRCTCQLLSPGDEARGELHHDTGDSTTGISKPRAEARGQSQETGRTQEVAAPTRSLRRNSLWARC